MNIAKCYLYFIFVISSSLRRPESVAVSVSLSDMITPARLTRGVIIRALRGGRPRPRLVIAPPKTGFLPSSLAVSCRIVGADMTDAAADPRALPRAIVVGLLRTAAFLNNHFNIRLL